MPESLPPHFIDLVLDAALKSFWRHRALKEFLRRCGVSQSFLVAWTNDESKRELLYRLFPELERAPKGPAVIRKLAHHLAEQVAFPDLEGWEDSGSRSSKPGERSRTSKGTWTKLVNKDADEKERVAARKRGQALQEERLRQQHDLARLESRLDELSLAIGTQEAGYAFQDWFYDLLLYYEADCRRPFVTPDGRQIDGSVTVDGTTYLLESKFTKEQAGAPDVDVFYKKVIDKADNTMGIMISISGYSSVAARSASGPRTPLLLLDHRHIYHLLGGAASFVELVRRVRRHSSQTGEAYLEPERFGG